MDLGKEKDFHKAYTRKWEVTANARDSILKQMGEEYELILTCGDGTLFDLFNEFTIRVKNTLTEKVYLLFGI